MRHSDRDPKWRARYLSLGLCKDMRPTVAKPAINGTDGTKGGKRRRRVMGWYV